MKVSHFVSILPRIFTSFRCLEKKSKVRESNQTGDNRHMAISPSARVAETGQNLDTDTPPVKTMTVL